MNIIHKQVIYTTTIDNSKYERHDKNTWKEETLDGRFVDCLRCDTELLEDRFQEAIKEMKYFTNDFK
jgi:predicted PP-loop superfamily ATPase